MFIIHHTKWKQPKFILNEWIKNITQTKKMGLYFSHKMKETLQFATTWMNLEESKLTYKNLYSEITLAIS